MLFKGRKISINYGNDKNVLSVYVIHSNYTISMNRELCLSVFYSTKQLDNTYLRVKKKEQAKQ